jgi:hypothetical protein
MRDYHNHDKKTKSISPSTLVHSISIRDLPRGEAERRADAPDAGHEPERLQVGEVFRHLTDW